MRRILQLISTSQSRLNLNPAPRRLSNVTSFQITQLSRQLPMSLSTKAGDGKLMVEHDPSGKKFYITLGKDEAKLEYVKNGDVLNMWHTEVPPALQGKGIAKVLAQEAFEYAVKNNLKMLLTCTYLQKFYRENPKEEYKRLVV